MISFQLTLLVLIIAGFLANKTKAIGREGKTSLINLLMNFIVPASIFSSFMGNTDRDIFSKSLAVLAVSFFIQALIYIFGKLSYRKMDEGKRKVLQYSIITSNYVFIGLPIVDVLYGPEGVALASISQIVYRVFVWTVGISVFMGNGEKNNPIKNLFTDVNVIAVFLGIGAMLINLKLPGFINNALSLLGGCMTPVCMIVIGYMLGDMEPRNMYEPVVLLYSAIRLVAIPAAVYFLLKPFRLEPMLFGITVIQAGMPAPATSVILAERYGADSAFASRIVLVSTLISILTVSVMCSLL